MKFVHLNHNQRFKNLIVECFLDGTISYDSLKGWYKPY